MRAFFPVLDERWEVFRLGAASSRAAAMESLPDRGTPAVASLSVARPPRKERFSLWLWLAEEVVEEPPTESWLCD